MAACLTCNADWSSGQFTDACEECGGGAMERPCFFCGGRCGGTSIRAVSDSNDSGLAHWAGACKLPKEEQRAILQRR